eukprot:3943468-Pyramimonas_sp.AAC.1
MLAGLAPQDPVRCFLDVLQKGHMAVQILDPRVAAVRKLPFFFSALQTDVRPRRRGREGPSYSQQLKGYRRDRPRLLPRG